ncbi:hypothetical protein [Propionivibrio sp.]|uniref:hypothetical protein n=1 Tax=Propionivibrio sp. TaxID=2212460 RepID=UPI0039E517D8
MKKEHQQHAAQCRHAKAIEAKRIYFQELSAHFATYRPTLPLKSRLTAYASSRRRAVLDYASRIGFKESTLYTWLREWKAQACVVC